VLLLVEDRIKKKTVLIQRIINLCNRSRISYCWSCANGHKVL